MKKDEKLESIHEELFRSFDPAAEPWVGGYFPTFYLTGGGGPQEDVRTLDVSFE